MTSHRMPEAFRWAARWGLRLLLVSAVLAGGIYGGLWYYLFGREGTPIESREMGIKSDPQAERWQRLERFVGEVDRALRAVDDLEAILYKQERIDGRLEPVARIALKQRSRPLSLYLRWEQPFGGREVIFQMHKRGNRLIAHEGGALRRVSPDLLMNRDNELALQFSRHPVHELSVQFVRRKLPMYVDDARANPDTDILIEEHDVIRGQRCIHMRLIHPPGSAAPDGYHRFDLYVNSESYLPIRWELYQRDEDGSDALFEYFELDELTINVGLTDDDFDPANEAYDFNPEWTVHLDPPPRPQDPQE